MSYPLVSVIMPCYNAEKFVKKSIESVLKQTYPNLELIIVNDGSTDASLSILKGFEIKGIKILSQENKGQDAALNNGYKHSTGEYIKFMDSDDLINPEMIELQMQTLNRSKEYIAYGEWARFYNNKPELADYTPLDYWKDSEPIDFLTARPDGVMLQCGIMLLPRVIIERSGLWDERLILFNDTEFFTRSILASKGIKFSKGAKLYYRSAQPGSISAGRSRRFFESTFLATCLIAEHLLPREDSYRTRKLISNTFQMQYGRMYPKFPDLGTKYREKINFYGGSNLEMEGGIIFLWLSKLLGWKTAKRIQSFFYDAGYYKLSNKLKQQKN